jgi:hypothetical protein
MGLDFIDVLAIFGQNPRWAANGMLTTTLPAWLGTNMGAGSGLDRQPR